ncbi:MAG: NAD(P)H-dependent oxidoreductase [Weeksellaceae bacterium]|nr:NAD(P)H-dependent oxidoreductase [Weeksellaceae bacterium]
MNFEHDLLTQMKWRYAAKRFDSKKKLSQQQMDYLLQAIHLAPTSLGLEAYKILVISDKEKLEALGNITFNQKQIPTCSHLLIFCHRTDISEQSIRKHVHYMEEVRGLEKGKLERYRESSTQFAMGMSEERREHWLENQVYIILGAAITACAYMGIDSCPMEGFNAALLDEHLGLAEKSLHSVVMLPVGYRTPEDALQFAAKVRYPESEMTEWI